MKKPLYQEIKEQFGLGPAAHITHVENLRGIIQNGLKSHKQMQSGQVQYFDISDASVQLGREQKVIPGTGLGLHDYVPLYFGWKSPMLMSHQDKNEDIIYLRFSLEILTTPGTVISDGNARSTNTKFFQFTDIDVLKNLNPTEKGKKCVMDILQNSGINKPVKANKGWYYVP